MPAVTPVYGIPYPLVTEAPNGPNQIRDAALEIEAELARIDALLATWTPTGDTQATSGTTTSISYTATLTGGTACGVAFTAPASGKVLIYNKAYFYNSAAGTSFSFCTARVRTGASIGSGSDVLAAADTEANVTTHVAAQTVVRLLTGLTAGSAYNVQQLFRVDAGTGTFLNKHLIVQPAP